MPDYRDDLEPIIAERPRREPPREDTQPLWRLVLALGAGLVAVLLVAWWWFGRPERESTGASSDAQPAFEPAEHIEQIPEPPARDVETDPSPPPAPRPATPQVTQTEAATPMPAESPPVELDEAPPAPPESPPAMTQEVPPAPATPQHVTLRFSSPDSQVRFELQDVNGGTPLTSRADEALDIPPGTYRVVSSGPQLERFEQELVLDVAGEATYAVELCAERARQRENVAGRVVEERTCNTTAECESLFSILSEYADQLVKDRDFRTQQCGAWRAGAVPEGGWTLDIRCGGASLTTTCHIEIAEGMCVFSEPARSVRGTACPRGELQ